MEAVIPISVITFVIFALFVFGFAAKSKYKIYKFKKRLRKKLFETHLQLIKDQIEECDLNTTSPEVPAAKLEKDDN